MITKKDLLLAYYNARKSRKDKQEVYLFEQNLEERLLDIFDDIKGKKYIHSDYKQIILHDSKKRYIFSPNFRDHIFHHIIYLKIYGLIDSVLLPNTFACRKGYGHHKAIKFLQKELIKSRDCEVLEDISRDFVFLEDVSEKHLYSKKTFDKYDGCTRGRTFKGRKCL